MTGSVRLLATATAAVLAAGCGGDSKPTSPEKVAVEWLQAKADYDGGRAWELESPRYRAGRTKDQAVEARKREKAQECPRSGASSCLFPNGTKFRATGERQQGSCRRVLVRTEYPTGRTSDGAVILLRVDDEWRVRDWKAALPEDELEAAAARDCGVS